MQKNLSKWIWFVNRQLNGSSRNNQFGEPRMKKRKEPARKTSVYLSKNNIEIFSNFKIFFVFFSWSQFQIGGGKSEPEKVNLKNEPEKLGKKPSFTL